MIQHVYERASAARGISEVIVATDDERIVQAVEVFGGRVRMTSATHRSGTERVAEIGRDLEVDVVVNLQGDEPMMDPGCIEAVVEPFRSDSSLMISTLKCSAEADEIFDPNVVKVVTDRNGNALYFSRSSIPHVRRQRLGKEGQETVFKHVGIYAFHGAFLETLPDLSDCWLEEVEDLEQLRFLYNGYRIRVVPYEYQGVAVDTPEDLVRINALAVRGKLPGIRAE
jgi:3-deoxy-manno-octulosonate cytidylyltransferase (CMP-KDO synthetase)